MTARRIWSRVMQAWSATPAKSAMKLHAITSGRMLTQRDPWVNLLRNTAACFAAGAAAQPQKGGMLRFGTAADIANLGFGSISFEILQGLYDAVLAYDDKLQPVPSLAERWDLSSDFKQIGIWKRTKGTLVLLERKPAR